MQKNLFVFFKLFYSGKIKYVENAKVHIININNKC